MAISALSVGAGDNKLVFDANDPAGMIRAARIVKDMIRRGYALLVQVGVSDDGKPIFRRCKDFDENTCEYIIADFDPEAARMADQQEKREADNHVARAEPTEGEQAEETQSKDEGVAAPSRGKAKTRARRIPASDADAVAVPKTAGG